MKKLQNKVNVDAPDATWLYGDINNNSGAGDGTPLDKEFTTDMAQFFERMMAQSSVVANDLPDNETNGWQIWEAFLQFARPYKSYAGTLEQTAGAAPIEVKFENTLNSTTDIVWARTGVGVYTGTLNGAFTAQKTWLKEPNIILIGAEVKFLRISNNVVEIRTYAAGVPSDDILPPAAPASFEIRVYP